MIAIVVWRLWWRSDKLARGDDKAHDHDDRAWWCWWSMRWRYSARMMVMSLKTLMYALHCSVTQLWYSRGQTLWSFCSTISISWMHRFLRTSHCSANKIADKWLDMATTGFQAFDFLNLLAKIVNSSQRCSRISNETTSRLDVPRVRSDTHLSYNSPPCQEFPCLRLTSWIVWSTL